MRLRHDPVALGTIQSASIETGAAIVSDLRFPPGSVLPNHTHERAIFGVMLDGAFESGIAGRRLECRVETAWIEPRGEPHANRIGPLGARVLAVQPDHNRADLFDGVKPLLADVRLIETAGLHADGRRLARELRSVDRFTSLTVDSLLVLMLTSAARLVARDHRRDDPPKWLLRVRDALHDRFDRPPRLEELSVLAGVSVSHLTHAFRRQFGVTPGEYVRRVRVQWAGDELVRTSRSLSEIALAAGYCDQSHFTRDIRRSFGVTPAEYRARHGRKPE
jgi:AraC family transcriptional regulator